MSDKQGSLRWKRQLLIQLADLRIEQTKRIRQPRAMHFQRCEHLAKFPARKVIRQLHDQPLGLFNGRKEGIHTRPFVYLISQASPSHQLTRTRRAEGRRTQEAATRPVKMIGATNVTAR